MSRCRWALCLVLTLLAAPARAATNQECLDCHRDPSLTVSGADGKEVPLYVGAAEFSSSVHADLSCSDCHADAVEIPHDEGLARVDCATCHSDVQDMYARSLHGVAQSKGDHDAPICADCHGTHDILPASNPASKVHPLNLVGTCARCHADPAVVKKHDIGAKAPVEAYMKSIHGMELLARGNSDAPNCGTCHAPHEMLAAGDPASNVNRANVAETCGLCHGSIQDAYLSSVHGTALAAGHTDAPTCIDCHSEHQIEAPTSPTSTVYPTALVKTTCVRCHESLVLARRYGLDANRVGSFRETYHGLASKKGDLSVANCASCHGVHNIYPPDDPRSTVNQANLPATCGQCHPNASEAFASIQVHPKGEAVGRFASGEQTAEAVAARSRPAHLLRTIYIWLIVCVIGGMAAHNLVLWRYHIREKRRRELKMGRVRRFSRLEVVEHQLNLVSFFTLVLTGFALKFPDQGWVAMTERIGMTEVVRGWIHRGAAVVMIAIALIHTGYLLFTPSGRRDLMALRFGIRDIRDAIHNVAFHLGVRKDRPRFPRFDYTEKAEYLALIWGTSVMILTGLILWFPTIATRYLPSWSFAVSEVVHYYEAWLAFLAIIVWHFYFVIVSPEVYPMNLTWLDGETTVDHAIHHHGSLEEGGLQQPKGGQGEKGTPVHERDPGKPGARLEEETSAR